MENVQSAANSGRNIEAQTQAQAVLARYAGIARVSDLYDHDAQFANALRDLAGPDFEFPDFSGLTVASAIKKAEKLGRTPPNNAKAYLREIRAAFAVIGNNTTDKAIKSFAREQFGNMPLSVIDAIADMSSEVQRMRVALTEVAQCLDGLGGDITCERVIGSNVDYVARARYVADVALGKRVEFPGEAQLLAEEGPYRYGYSAAMRGFSIEYPSNIRSNAEKTGWTDGYCAGKRAREAMLKGMAHAQFNGRTLVPTIAGYSPETFKAVWRDERAGKDYTEVPTSGTQPAAQRYRVYHLTDTRPGSVRELSHNHELLDVQRDSVQAATLFATPAQTCEYRLVAEVEAVELDDVFKLTNTIEQHWWLNPEVQAKFPAAGCRSTSAGDIVLDAAGMAYFCDRFGWIDLGPLEPAKPATSI
ncbi:hypothetical protein KDW40_19150 [Burkholderia cenocepacia]|uniref:hypothetical protein n=1 Tax=Burkholderia cenocepacia TaxID=95486 RepID=UPI001B97D503|nr:hypothetical protein [Burkholderia cenocepacia]MBR8043488.1 hypothetical protein [Burkholderia cenocepacia]MBR8327849.1 hypothetical protein [Burkholderia cenocepacia]